jgi:hypothetical protein
MTVAWPAPSTGFVLQETEAIGAIAGWTDVAGVPTPSDGLNSVKIAVTNAGSYFRLLLR